MDMAISLWSNYTQTVCNSRCIVSVKFFTRALHIARILCACNAVFLAASTVYIRIFSLLTDGFNFSPGWNDLTRCCQDTDELWNIH